jgi:hypothetical protein
MTEILLPSWLWPRWQIGPRGERPGWNLAIGMWRIEIAVNQVVVKATKAAKLGETVPWNKEEELLLYA